MSGAAETQQKKLPAFSGNVGYQNQRQLSGVKETQRKRLFIDRRNGDLSILGIFEPLSFIAGDEKDDFSLLGCRIPSTAEGDNLGC